VGDNTLRICDDDEEEYKIWRIDGEPGMEIKATRLDTMFTTASQAVNRIPDAINADPGYVTLRNLPKLTFKSKPYATYIQNQVG
jgi:4-hydroxy-tetrahydrodipicolinate reductase